MKTKVRFKKPKFIVKNNVTTCILKVDLALDTTKLIHRFSYIYNNTLIKKLPKEISEDLQFTCIGVAKCGPDDTFDKRTGEIMSESKAKKHAFKMAQNIYGQIIKSLEKDIEGLKALKEGCYYAEQTEVKHIEKLSK